MKQALVTALCALALVHPAAATLRLRNGDGTERERRPPARAADALHVGKRRTRVRAERR
jgi:hypothetical protein